jgi:hypothetical protein
MKHNGKVYLLVHRRPILSPNVGPGLVDTKAGTEYLEHRDRPWHSV